MAAITLTVNGKKRKLDLDPEMPLLWALRDSIGLTGTKYGCGIGQCGACTVLVEGEPMRSCSLPVSVFEGKKITTIEGLSESGNHPVQQVWVLSGRSNNDYRSLIRKKSIPNGCRYRCCFSWKYMPLWHL
jgi:isoquinoline 1-oxidoreductase alpha subunit